MTKQQAILGAILGDYYGSYWEFKDDKPTSLEDALTLRPDRHEFTDDTFMTLAVARAILTYENKKIKGTLGQLAVRSMQYTAQCFPSSYGGAFARFLLEKHPKPYGSWGNGAAMRISPVGLAYGRRTDQFLFDKCDAVTKVSHDHVFAIRFARMVCFAVALGFRRYDKETDPNKEGLINELKEKFPDEMKEILAMDLEDLHENYQYTESSQGTVPQAMYCFLSSSSLKDCLARSIYIGGDSDTMAAIACSMAAPYYGDDEVVEAIEPLPDLPFELQKTAFLFSKRFL